MTRDEEVEFIREKVWRALLNIARLRRFRAYIDDDGCINKLRGNDHEERIESLELMIKAEVDNALLRLSTEENR